MPAPVEYIDNSSQLKEVVSACLLKEVVSIDTEFARFNTYYPIVGLIQIYDGEICYLIDPLAIPDLSSFAELLVAPHVLKVFHACSEDMEVFQHCVGALPTPVIDSQIAAAALGVGFSVSYQKLVENYLSIVVPKEETRSDWLQRPLTKAQLDYAALDVIYLLRVYRIQKEALQAVGRTHWVEEECSQLSTGLATMIDPELAFEKIKGLSRLNRKQLSVLRALCAWREIRARESDVPRNRIVDQKSLVAIAGDNVRNKEDLQSAAGMSPRQVRKIGDDLLFLADEARLIPEDQCPALVSKSGARVDSNKLGILRQVVQDKAESLGIAPELLTKRRYLEKLLRSVDGTGRYELPAELSGWRKDVIGDDLIEALA
jgi:ribonuclease D